MAISNFVHIKTQQNVEIQENIKAHIFNIYYCFYYGTKLEGGLGMGDAGLESKRSLGAIEPDRGVDSGFG